MPPSTLQRDALLPRRPGGMGPGLMLALIVHALLIVALAIGVNWRSREPDSVQAELWAAVPQTAAPRAVEPTPTPQPTPAPPPKPEPPPPQTQSPPEPPRPDPDAQIAIEKAKREEAQREQLRQQQEQERKEQERKKQELAKKQAEEAAEKQAAEKRAVEKRKQEAEAERKRQQAEEKRLAALREDNIRRMMGQVGATGDASSTGTAAQSAGPSAGYAGRIKGRIKPNIVFTDDPVANPIAEVEVRLAPDGRIMSQRLLKSSGLKEWDDAVQRAVDRTEVLPRDVDGRVPPTIVLAFRPRD